MTKDEALKLALYAIENMSVKSANGLEGSDMERLASAATALREASAQQERNFCSRCGKRLRLEPSVHTCTPPRTFDDYGNKIA